jgi:alpha/beta superfamily hydrolase
MTEAVIVQQPSEFPSQKTDIRLRGPVGWLETITDCPPDPEALPAVAVICHPHTQHGGTFHNKVVTILERSLRELGLPTVRFNFRGAGESEGSYDDGYGETDDLLAVIEWIRKVRPADDLWLAGFSFGAYISLRAAQTVRLGQLISVAPAVDRYEFSKLESPSCPWMIIHGDEDEVAPCELVQKWAKTLSPAPSLMIMEQADHFFHRRLMDLRGLIKNGVRTQLPKAPQVSENLP